MSVVQQAIDRLYDALATVDGLRIARGVGVRLDPPAVLVAPPRLRWGGFGPEPTEATFTVPVCVRADERAMVELMRWTPLVVEAIDGIEGRVAVQSADPGLWTSGGGVDLPAYLIQVEVGLF